MRVQLLNGAIFSTKRITVEETRIGKRVVALVLYDAKGNDFKILASDVAQITND